MMVLRESASAALLAALLSTPASATPHSYEYVQEHLPEAAMDNRFATLPLWLGDAADSWQGLAQVGYASTGSGNLRIAGAMTSLATQHRLNARWSVTGFGFLDRFRFSGSNEQRPLETLITTTPLALPADALFTGLHGSARHHGIGLAMNLRSNGGWLGEHQWAFGAMWQREQLRNYRVAYRVLSGASAGATGFADYSGTYSHLTPFAGFSLPRQLGSWRLAPHAQFAIPIPKRSVVGRITGPGFDLSGDTASAGNAKHFGNVSMTLGLDIRYQPWGLSVDVGSLASQALLEGVAHKGIERNWLLSTSWAF
jgi:hypothetical protein